MRDLATNDDLGDVQHWKLKEGLRHSIRPIRSRGIEVPLKTKQTPVDLAGDDAPTGLGMDSTLMDTPAMSRPSADTPAASNAPAENGNTVFKLKRPEHTPLPEVEDLEAEIAADEPFMTLKSATPYSPPVLTEPDLPRWDELSKIRTGARMGKGPTLPVVDAERESVSVRAFDLLRTRLRQTTQEHGWTSIAITSPTSGCGNTFTCVNLALSLSRITGSRTVLMDFNLRQPGVAKALDMRPRGSMADFLTGHAPIGDHMIRISDTLALGLNNIADENAAETLQAAETSHTLERMRAALQPELVIYDMPAMLAHDDVSAFLPHVDAVLLVSDGTKTMSKELMECERRLEGKVPLLGVVLNRARNNSIKRYS